MAKRVLLIENIDEAVTEAEFLQADAILLCTLPDEELGRMCRLICQGERVLPTTLIKRFLPQDGQKQQDKQDNKQPQQKSLTPREVEIVRHLQRGIPNKLIARRVGITEATVKVHLKSILAKLSLVNRTQAAIWAQSNLPPEGALAD